MRDYQFQQELQNIQTSFHYLCKNKLLSLLQISMVLILSFFAMLFLKELSLNLPASISRHEIVFCMIFYYLIFLTITTNNFLVTQYYLNESGYKSESFSKLSYIMQIVLNIIVWSFITAFFSWFAKLSETLSTYFFKSNQNWRMATNFIYPIMLTNQLNPFGAMHNSINLLNHKHSDLVGVQSIFCITFIIILLVATEFLPFYPAITIHMLIAGLPILLMLIILANTFDVLTKSREYVKLQRIINLKQATL